MSRPIDCDLCGGSIERRTARSGAVVRRLGDADFYTFEAESHLHGLRPRIDVCGVCLKLMKEPPAADPAETARANDVTQMFLALVLR